jgi:hypothetical protein
MGNYEYSVHLPVVSCSQDILVWHRVEYIAWSILSSACISIFSIHILSSYGKHLEVFVYFYQPWLVDDPRNTQQSED